MDELKNLHPEDSRERETSIEARFEFFFKVSLFVYFSFQFLLSDTLHCFPLLSCLLSHRYRCHCFLVIDKDLNFRFVSSSFFFFSF